MNNAIKVIFTEDLSQFTNENMVTLDKYNIEPVFCNKDGEELILKIRGEKPDAVLMDLFMTRLDSLGVMRKIKETVNATNI